MKLHKCHYIIQYSIGTLGGSFSVAFGINASGQVVGEASTSGDATYHAMLYSGGVMYDLNNLIPAGSGWELEYASSINDAGQIVGFGAYSALQHAFLLTPGLGPPTDKDQCKSGGWEKFTVPRKFKNQGDCVSFVNTGK